MPRHSSFDLEKAIHLSIPLSAIRTDNVPSHRLTIVITRVFSLTREPERIWTNSWTDQDHKVS